MTDRRNLYSPIRVEFIGGRFVRVLETIYWSGPFPAGVSSGFVSDGGSIPAIAWPIVGHPLSAGILIAYLLHDAELKAKISYRECTRRLDARLRALAISNARRVAIVMAVKINGRYNSFINSVYFSR